MEGRSIFFEKKKQKAFDNLELANKRLLAVRPEPIEQKFFACFFQKRCFFLRVTRITGRGVSLSSILL